MTHISSFPTTDIMALGIRFVLGYFLILFTFVLQTFSLSYSRNASSTTRKSTLLQDIVTLDQYSVSVRGERILLLSGEFHPFRLPSPDLWYDVFEKVRALGYSAVSFYLDWALLEGEKGHVRVDGIFALDKFFDSASKAGVYLIARPGPFINAETSGGGFPGWLSRRQGRLRTSDPDFLDAIALYISVVGGLIAKAQITEGGPVILLQPENEYTLCASTMGYTQDNNVTFANYDSSCLDKEYMSYVETKFREAGIVVPLIVNDAFPLGNFAPGKGEGAVDIYSFDNYPLGWGIASMSEFHSSTNLAGPSWSTMYYRF